MRVRIYFPFFPYPFTEAAFQVVFNQCHDLADFGHQVELVVWKEDLGAIQKKLKSPEFMKWNPKVLITSLLNPKIAGQSSIEILQEITKAWPRIDYEEPPRFERVAQSLFGDYASSETFHYPLDLQFEYLPEVDLSIFHYSFCYPWLLHGRPKNTKKVAIQFHNLEHELFRERARGSFGPVRWIHSHNAKKLKNHEIKLFEMADEIWHISPVDMERYKGLEWIPKTNISPALLRLVSPTMRPELREFRVTEWQKTRAQCADKLRLGFIGSLKHGPNISSARWILENICPLLKAQGFEGEIIFAGQNSDTDLRKLSAHYPFVKFLGFLPDVEVFWRQLSYLLVPHIEGSGMRVKILDSLMSGVPVLCNTLAAKRLHPVLQNSSGLFVSDQPTAWLQQISGKSIFEEREELSRQRPSAGMSKELILDFLK